MAMVRAHECQHFTSYLQIVGNTAGSGDNGNVSTTYYISRTLTDNIRPPAMDLVMETEGM